MPRLAKDAKQQSSGKITRNPKCARCRNHGFIVQLKGHAGKCEFHHCACWKCSLITERTKIMAFQRRIKKSQAEEAEPGEPASAQAEDAPQVPPTASHGNGAGQVAQEARTPTAGAAAQGTGSDAQDPDLYPGDLLTMPIPVKLYPYYGNPYACQTLLLNMAGAGADSVPGLPHFQSAGVPYSPEVITHFITKNT
uniref:DM domain-containing protein n=1 Tax=Paramormyrops kingsleyae TaxID=1676925 RepID=A0A3B3T7E9_9TELE